MSIVFKIHKIAMYIRILIASTSQTSSAKESQSCGNKTRPLGLVF